MSPTPRFLTAALASAVAFGPLLVAVPASAAPAAVRVAGTSVKVEGADNVRDIGGPATRDGRHVRTGVVYRAASLSKVTPGGVQALARLRLTASVDFRWHTEVLTSGRDRLPAGVAPVAAPINPASPALLELGPDVLRAVLAKDKAAGLMEVSYRTFVHDRDSRAQFAATLKRIASGKGPVLYHCTAGKDRTGTMSAILLTALGVDREQVYADFLRSNGELAASNAATLDKLKKYGLDPKLVEPLLTVRASYLDAAFDQIERDYGTFDAFLAKGLGVDAATKRRLRAALLR